MSPLPAKKKSSQPIRSSTEFARYVGLARTTVSRVLNGQPGLKQKTIDRVRKAMDETGFVPNAHALFLKGKLPASVGICVQGLVSQPLLRKLAELQRVLRERGYPSFIEVMDGGGQGDVVRHFLSLRVAAVVFLGHFEEDVLNHYVSILNDHHTPHLVLEQLGIKQANMVTLDRGRAMTELINHLLALGHRSFNLLAFSSQMRSTRDRLRAVKETVSAAGLDPAKCIHTIDQNYSRVYTRTNDFEFGREVTKGFLSRQRADLSTAFVAINDEVAIGAMRELQDAGLKVPEDVSVVGFNNQDVCLMTTPMLTSVDHNVEASTSLAADCVVAQLTQSSSKRAMLLSMVEPMLKVRGSTGPARSGPLAL